MEHTIKDLKKQMKYIRNKTISQKGEHESMKGEAMHTVQVLFWRFELS